jgi:hypothetical protein
MNVAYVDYTILFPRAGSLKERSLENLLRNTWNTTP